MTYTAKQAMADHLAALDSCSYFGIVCYVAEQAFGVKDAKGAEIEVRRIVAEHPELFWVLGQEAAGFNSYYDVISRRHMPPEANYDEPAPIDEVPMLSDRDLLRIDAYVERGY